jgi:eukaryotic-like serine/threonine-protein kinase
MVEPRRCLNCGREMPPLAPQGLCPACLFGGVLDSEVENQTSKGEPKSTAGAPGEPPGAALNASNDAKGAATHVFSEQSDPSTDSEPTANFAPSDELPGNDGSVDPGTRIRYFGDYEIHGELGSGAMGIVYKARQISLNRTVAVKMIRAGALASEAELRRFQNEAEAIARLDHPQIVPIYEVGEHDGKRYFSMKLIGGPCLSRTLSSYTVNPQDAAKLMVTTAEAVHHAHQRGILHRDLKPSNILLDQQRQPHVSDFGLARHIGGDDSLTESGAVLGTPAYMAPEQAAGSKMLVTTLSDVYGLGAVLYALLAGKPPFGGDSLMAMLDHVRQQQPVPPSRINPKVPRDLEIICLKCLDKDPQRRYPSAQAFGAELRRFLDGEPIQARPVSALEKGWRWCLRRPVIAGLTSALVTAVLVGLIGTTLGLLAALHARQDALNREREAREAQATALLARGDAERESGRAKAQTEVAAQRLYDVRMNLVQRYWEDYHRQLFQQGLVEQLPANQGGIDRRGFEWFYWQRRISSLSMLKGHTNDVTSLEFSPDGKRLASADSAGAVKVWDARTGQETLNLKGHSVAFSPNGNLLAAGSNGGIKVWDVATGHVTVTLKGDNAAMGSVVFSPDGKRLASATWNVTVKVWDAATGQETATLKGHTNNITRVEFSPDGKRLASADSDGALKVWTPGPGRNPSLSRDSPELPRALRSALTADGSPPAPGTGR